MKKKYVIFTPPYDENSGGVIVLHKLCSILNQLGRESYLVSAYNPYYRVYRDHLHIKSIIGLIRRVISRSYRQYRNYRNFKVSEEFNTPVWLDRNTVFDDEWIVVYPEFVFGNPLDAKNVVRWLLHNPGFFSGDVFYGKNELIIKFDSALSDFHFPGSTTSKNYLKVIHYPLNYYNMDDVSYERKGTAYCLRKGRDKPIQHDLTDSILIDGLPHAEVAKIFKRVKTFISYDVYTAYSIFAVLCGCDSIVIPDEGVSEEEWFPDPKDRYGLSYGFDGVEKARKTAHLVREHVIQEERKSVDDVRSFIAEAEEFFNQ